MQHLILEVPFTYVAQTIPPRKRNVVPVKIVSTVAVRLRVCGPEELPVALRVRLGREDRSRDLRWDGRNLLSVWRPDLWKGDSRGSIDEAELYRRIAAREMTPFAEPPQDRRYNVPRPIREADMEGRLVSDNSAEARAEVIAEMQRLTFFEGQLWQVFPEPCWLRKPDWNSPYMEVVTLIGDGPTKDAANLFRADCYEQGAATMQGSERPVQKSGSLEILLPEAIRHSFDTAQLHQVAARVLDKVKEHLHTAPLSYMIAFAKLRDALTGADQAVVTEELAEAVESMIHELPDTGRWGTEHLPKAALTEAHGRWRTALLAAVHAPGAAGPS